MEQAVAILLAKQEITEQIYRYSRGYDRMDAEIALTVWHKGGTVAYGNRYDGPIADWIEPSWAYRSKLRGFMHQVGNILIEVNGDKAASESYLHATLQFPPENGVIVEDIWRGRYMDTWSKRDGVWALDHRLFVPDSYAQITYPAEKLDESFLEMSRTDKSDPSYAMFEKLRAGE